MTIPTISTLPTAPARTDPPATFVTRADSFLAALVIMQSELNTSIGAMNTDISGIAANVTAAQLAETNAETAETNAELAESNAEAQVVLATAQVALATNQVTLATTQAGNAATSATAAANSYDQFDDRYLGAFATDPATDNDGNALQTGAQYFNTSNTVTRVYNGSAWQDSAALATSVSLSQVTDFPTQSGQSGKYLTTNGTTPSWGTLSTDPTLGTLTKTFTSGESSTIDLTSSVLAPVVSVTKEVPQSGVTNNNWDVNSTTENYTRLNSAPATTLNWGVDLANASYVSGFNIGSQETVAQGLAFSSDGTKMYIVGLGVDTVFQYSLSTAFDVSTASYNAVSFSVASQETTPLGLDFSADGTKMYVVGYTNSIVYQYSLSTAWDLSTASYSSISFDLNSQETQAIFVSITSNGTKMYIRGFDNGNVFYQYTLSTAYDVSTASYDSISFNPSANATDPKSLSFSTNGTLLYIMGGGSDAVYQYSLSTAFNISTATYDSISFSVASQDNQPADLAVIGSKLYFIGGQNTSVYQYSLPAGNLALGTGSFSSADVGKTIEANDGVFVLTATDGSYVETTAPTSYDQVASGSWEMYGVVYNAADGDLELSGIVDGYNLTEASYDSVSFTTTSQETAPYFCKFDTSGLSMYVGGIDADTVFQYTLTTAFDISTATYASISKSLSAQSVTRLQDIAFKTDGTKMYVLDDGANVIYQYSLSTAWNVSTATYDSVSFSLSSAEWLGLQFSPDGSTLFLLSLTGDTVYDYALSTAWDVSSASSVGSFVITQESTPIALGFNADGTKMFVAGTANDTVYQYSLASAWSLSGAAYDSISFSVAAQATTPVDITFNNDGTKMYIVDIGLDTIYQYSTGSFYFSTGYQPVHTTDSIDTTYWTDINSMTADQAAGDGNVYYAISTDDRTTWTVIDNTDGERDIVRNNAGTWQYNSNGTYASETWTNATTNTELATLAEAMEGAVGYGEGYNLSVAAYDSKTFSFASQDTGPSGIAFNLDGTKMYMVGQASDSIHQYSLSTSWDVSSASYDSVSLSIVSQDGNSENLVFNNDGTKLFIAGRVNDSVYQYNLSTAFDLSTASYSSNSFSVASQDGNPQAAVFNTNGTKMFVLGSSTDTIYQYSLSTGFDVSTASYDSVSLSVTSQDANPAGLTFNSDGTKMFMSGYATDAVHQYSLSTAFDLSTATYDSISFSVASQDTQPSKITFGNSGAKLFVLGGINDSVFQYTSAPEAYTNQMDKTQLDAVTDPNHIALGDDLDLSIIFNMTSGSTVPSSDGVAINYDANVLNKGAVLGTDYDFDAPAGDKARITALTAGNFKVRVV